MKQSYMSMLKSLLKRSLLHYSLTKLILLASVFHVAVTITVLFAGHLAILPNLFKANGILVRSDSNGYLTNCIYLKDSLYQGGIAAWLSANFQMHNKLYALSYLAFGWLLGDNILSFEPLNLFYYAAIIFLLFKLGEEIFDRQTGLLAGCAVALWPSFLIHTTQLFRDPAFIAAMLLLVLIISRWLTRTYAWKKGLLSIITSIFASLALSLIRDSLWELTLGIIFTGAAMLLLRQILERRVLMMNTIAAVSLIVFVCLIPHDFDRKAIDIGLAEKEMLRQQMNSQSNESSLKNSEQAGNESRDVKADDHSGFGKATALRLSAIRHYTALGYLYRGSNIDEDVKFFSLGDVIRYIPRAITIGFFAPFPNTWFVANGSMGFAAKWLSGIETFLMWAVEALAIYGLWQSRKQLSAWLLLLIAALGVTALSIVVVNLGALYRMRYVFWMLIIILGARGLSALFFSKDIGLNAEIGDA
jgi:putative peptidoglycan lipid II flippase